MKSLLQLKDLPFLLTILFTLMGWTFMKLSDSVTESPTIEYKLSKQVNNARDSSIYSYRLINLTNNKKFKDLEFKIQISPNGRNNIYNADLISVPPNSQTQSPPTVQKTSATFAISNFNPKSEYILKCFLDGNVNIPIFSVSVSDDVLYLREASIFTFFVKNEEYIYAALFAILFVLIFSYFVILKQKGLSNDTQN